MIILLTRLLKWLTGKVAIIAFLILAIVLTTQLSNYFKTRIRNAEDLKKECELVVVQSKETIANLENEVASIKSEVDSKARELSDLKGSLDSLSGGWDGFLNFFGLGDLEEKTEAQEGKIRNAEAEVSRKKSELDGVQAQENSVKDKLEDQRAELANAKHQLAMLNKESFSGFFSSFGNILYNTLLTCGWIVAIVLFGPSIYKIIAYYILASMVKNSRAIHLDRSTSEANTSCNESKPAHKVALAHGELLVLKQAFLQGSNDDFTKKHRFLLSYKRWFICLLCDLTNMIEIKATSETRHGKTVTISHQEDGLTELSMITLKEGDTLSFRPRFLIGMIYLSKAAPIIKSHWTLGNLHSWLTLQLRHYTISGPVTLIVAAGRGVEEERLMTESKGFRINRGLPLAYSPSLQYKSIKAETFWSYFLGKSPLFDDYFIGSGVIYTQQISTSNEGTEAEGLWGKILSGFGKFLGV